MASLNDLAEAHRRARDSLPEGHPERVEARARLRIRKKFDAYREQGFSETAAATLVLAELQHEVHRG